MHPHHRPHADSPSDPVSALSAARAAASAVKRMTLYSRVVDVTKEEYVAPLHCDEIIIGDLLGSGGFSNVYEVVGIELRPQQHQEGQQAQAQAQAQTQKQQRGGGRHDDAKKQRDDDDLSMQDNNDGIDKKLKEEDKDIQHTTSSSTSTTILPEFLSTQEKARQFLSRHVLRETTGDARYAIKFLKPQVMSDRRRFRVGASDLAVEAKFLSSLEHPNIIKIRAVSSQGVGAGFASGRIGGYFLLLDRLYDTLEQRIHVTWKTQARKFQGLIRRRLVDARGWKRREMLAHQLQVAFDIAGALRYLHDKNIIYRDLKPENIGFDVRNDVKIFDFGLAKEIYEFSQTEHGTYELSGNTGSLRYMAPEVAKSQPYNVSVDVYSFVMVLWEMLHLERPYAEYTRSMHSELVVHGGQRPNLSTKKWSQTIRSLLKRGWSENWKERPTMHAVYKILRREIATLRGGDASGLEHGKRRSTWVLQRSELRSNRNLQRALLS